MLKILLFLVAALVVVVIVTVVVGYLLPEKHVSARVIEVRQKPEVVFALISDFASAPSWRSDVKRVEILSEQNGRARYREEGDNGTLTMEVTELRSPERMVTEIADKNLPFGGRWIFEIFPTSQGCRLNITERGEIYNPVFRVVSRFFLGYTHTLDAYLKNLARKFGESTSPEEGTVAHS